MSNADRVVFPDAGVTKGDVVSYYERIAPKLLPQVVDRPISIHRFPKGLAGQGFFQKNVPPHYPESIGRLSIPRSPETGKRHKKKTEQDVSVYPLISSAEHLAYLANQNALELHVPIARVADEFRPDRLVIDLDPPSGAFDLVRRAAFLVRAELEKYGLGTIPVATGSKGYHLVALIRPDLDSESLSLTLQKLASLLAAKYPDELTTVFRVALRGERVFVDWLRNRTQATVIAPYSLRARPRATVAVPLRWDEVPERDPDAFTIRDLDGLLDRDDPFTAAPQDVAPFVAAIDEASS